MLFFSRICLYGYRLVRKGAPQSQTGASRPAMGIIGGLIIGDAAVQAGIVSPFLVIVVAVTAISSFSIPTYSAGITLRVLRFAGISLRPFWAVQGEGDGIRLLHGGNGLTGIWGLTDRFIFLTKEK